MSKCRHRLPHMLSNYITTSTPRPPSSPVQQHQVQEQPDDQDPQLLPQHLQVCDQAPQHVQDDPSLPPHPQLAGRAEDEGGGGEAVHQGVGGAGGVADHRSVDEHHVEPRRRGLRPKKIVRYNL